MASLTQWTWVWASSGSWWWTGKPGVLQSIGLQRVRHDWATELNWIIYATRMPVIVWESESVGHCYAWLFVTPWAVAPQTSLSMEFSRQEYRSGLPFPSPGKLPNPGIKLQSPALQADSLLSEPPGKPLHMIKIFFMQKETGNVRVLCEKIFACKKKLPSSYEGLL